MIDLHIDKMNKDINNLKNIIDSDIKDIREANHKSIQERIDIKNSLIDSLKNDKIKLNQLLIAEVRNGKDVNIYKKYVDNLEQNLHILQKKNRDFATILMPVKKLYEDLINETFGTNSRLVQVKA